MAMLLMTAMLVMVGLERIPHPRQIRMRIVRRNGITAAAAYHARLMSTFLA
jgi:hypothetical protein